ncbi:DNA-directed RNA polymerase subunit beta [Salvia divinorum]|uniref:DNA-directed RNA polymerase subunit beta n=1 Tax=Salvia divinorum TaxID=28513 RepID=A0ABD1I6A5_SALDI
MRTLVRSLSTKLRIAIQVVDKILVKINCFRDEELWPQLNEFIQGLTRMWKSMLECHQSQCQAIGEAKRLDVIAFPKHFSDTHFEVTRKLQHDVINWTLSPMRDFASTVLHLWDHDKAEMRQRMLANKDEREVKSLDKEDKKMQKEIQALDKRMVVISADDNGMPFAGHVICQSETTKGGSL